MIRLLMVDDEPTTIRRILSRIDFAAIGITEIREAGDSEEALKICGEWQPDILLSDIMMPKMNGIELTARIREMYPSLQVIFLSGYMEKEFLKGAIHLQVIDYIEKPIDMAELTRTLETAVERVQSSENSSVRLEKMGGEYELSLKRKLALELSHEKCDPALTERYFKELFPGEQAVHCFAMQLCFYQPEEKEFSTLLGFIPAIQQAADACMLQVAAAVRYDYIAAFIFAGEKKRISDKVFFVSEYLRELRKELVLRNSVYTIGTGHVCQALAELPESFSEALQATDLAFFHGPGYHSYYRKNARKFDFEQSGARDIISGIKKNGRESTVFRLREMQTELSRSEGTDPEDIRRFYSSIILQLFREAMEDGIRLYPDCPGEHDLLRMVNEKDFLPELWDFLLEGIESYCAALETDHYDNATVNWIIRYIHEHYSDPDLDMTVLGRESNLSTTYISHLFKNITGQTVRNYITDFRMKEAVRLLKNPLNQINDIAAQCGYRDGNYFSYRFREYYGCAPSDYKEQRE